MKLLSDEQIRDLLFTSPANSYVEAFRVVVEAQLESCEAELKTERERIIQEIEERGVFWYESVMISGSQWQSLKVRIREGVNENIRNHR